MTKFNDEASAGALVTLAAAAREVGVDAATLQKHQVLPITVIGRHRYVPALALRAWLRQISGEKAEANRA